MGVDDDEYEGGPDHLVERLAEVDEELAEQRAEARRASLADYELDDEDADLLAGLAEGDDGIQVLPALPVVSMTSGMICCAVKVFQQLAHLARTVYAYQQYA